MILISKLFQELSLEELYGLLKLRIDVFVSEQRRPLADLDGKDLHPKTLHLSGRRNSARYDAEPKRTTTA